MSKAKPVWSEHYSLAVRKFVEDINFNNKFQLQHCDNEVHALQGKFEKATTDRTAAWDKFAHELTGLKPGDIFRDQFTEYVYVGYAPIPCTTLTPNKTKFQVGDNFIHIYVLPYVHGNQKVQVFRPQSLPLAPIARTEVPELAEMWVRLRDPVLKFEHRAPPWIELNIPTRIPIRIPVPTPKLTKRSKR